MANSAEPRADESSPGGHATTPDRVASDASSSSEIQWVIQALNRLDARLDGVEKRLRRLEIRLVVAMGFALCMGIVIGLIARVVSFDFRLAIVPVS